MAAPDPAVPDPAVPDPAAPSRVDDCSLGCGGPGLGRSWRGPEPVFGFEAVKGGDVTLAVTGRTADLDRCVKEAAPGGD